MASEVGGPLAPAWAWGVGSGSGKDAQKGGAGSRGAGIPRRQVSRAHGLGVPTDSTENPSTGRLMMVSGSL